jgi:hypothetical protein
MLAQLPHELRERLTAAPVAGSRQGAAGSGA